ncbi:hypothetical protein TNCV_3771031 [Trichonephila clavipes]|nr:hypothetical protein TNCV_3771031 [Trichonephila clavipes]
MPNHLPIRGPTFPFNFTHIFQFATPVAGILFRHPGIFTHEVPETPAAIRFWRNGLRPYYSVIYRSLQKANNNGVQKPRNSHNQGLTFEEFIEIQEQDIEELESLDPVQSGDRMTVGNWTEGLDLIEKGLQILGNTDSKEEKEKKRQQQTSELPTTPQLIARICS